MKSPTKRRPGMLATPFARALVVSRISLVCLKYPSSPIASIDAQHCAMRPPEREPAMVGVVYNPPAQYNGG